MNIRIGDFVLRNDAKNFAIDHIKICEDEESKNFGSEYAHETWYPANLYEAVISLRDKMVAGSDVESLKELKQLMNDFAKEVHDKVFPKVR